MGSPRGDLISTVLSFFNSNFIQCRCNASFISFVPKKDNPASLNDFWSISLVGCVYKVISKILAYWINRLLSSVINIHRSTFLGGRGMLDIVLMANEIIDFMKKQKEERCIGQSEF